MHLVLSLVLLRLQLGSRPVILGSGLVHASSERIVASLMTAHLLPEVLPRSRKGVRMERRRTRKRRSPISRKRRAHVDPAPPLLLPRLLPPLDVGYQGIPWSLEGYASVSARLTRASKVLLVSMCLACLASLVTPMLLL